MATTAGLITVGTVKNTSASLVSAPATGGATPYTYQWYRSITSGFTPGGGNAIAGATSLTLDDDELAQGTQYYYKVIAIDADTTPGTSAQASVLTTTLTAGALTASNVGARSVALTAAAATLGTTPYTYQWYRSQTSDFTPGGGNILSGKTALSFVDDTIVPGVQYYYKVISTDASTTPQTATSAQLSVLASTNNQSMNQFTETPFLGMLDLRYNYNSLAVQIDNGQTGTVIAGQAMKYTQDAGGVPKVEKCTANTDVVAGFINYDIKTQEYVALDMAEMSQRGNVMYLVASAAISRGAKVMIDVAAPGLVVTATTGKPICGWAQDPATAPGQLIRVEITTPAFETVP